MLLIGFAINSIAHLSVESITGGSFSHGVVVGIHRVVVLRIRIATLSNLPVLSFFILKRRGATQKGNQLMFMQPIVIFVGGLLILLSSSVAYSCTSQAGAGPSDVLVIAGTVTNTHGKAVKEVEIAVFVEGRKIHTEGEVATSKADCYEAELRPPSPPCLEGRWKSRRRSLPTNHLGASPWRTWCGKSKARRGTSTISPTTVLS